MATASEVWDDLIALLQDRISDYTFYHEYWMGEQALAVDTSEFRSRFGNMFAGFRDNLARPVIESAEGRVRIREFGDGTGLGEDALALWRRNRMKVESRWVHTEAMVKGDAFVIVLPKENDDAGIWPQISESCAVLYSEIDPRDKVAAIKWWVEDFLPEGTSTSQFYVRINLYFDDRIERFISTSQSETLIDDLSKYREYDDEGESVTRHQVGEVPMFQFAPGYDLTAARGRSDLADATGLVDSVNKTFLDMLVSSEYTAAPQRWATGVEIPLDPQTGEPVQTYRSGADRLWTAPSDDARFGQFTPGDLSNYGHAIDTLVDHLAFTTRTPAYSLMKEVQYPSGEALRSAEGPLRSRVSDHQDAFGSVWVDILVAALGLDGITVEEEDRPDIDPSWIPVNAPFATAELLAELKVKGEVLGVPEEMLWREAGYTAEEIDDMKAMREDEATLGVDALASAQTEAILGTAPAADTDQGGLLTSTESVAAEDPTQAPQ